MSQHRVEDESKSVLAIVEPAPDMLVASRLRISGTCATSGALRIDASRTHYPAVASGSWSIEEDLKELGSTVLQITATQGARSETRHVYIQDYSQVPQITEPADGGFFSSAVRVEGLALSGATVTVRDPEQGVLGTTTAGRFGHWALDIAPAVGELSITATQNISTGTPDPSLPVRLTVGVPSITAPDAGSLQGQVVTLHGNGGRPGHEIQVFLDTTQIRVGQTPTLTEPTWEASVSLNPGPVTLVAQQFLGEVGSARSVPRMFKIQPPALVSIEVEHPSISSAKFSGTGLNGATVEIKIVSGSADASPPPVVVVSNGKWEVTSQKWPLGSYTLSAVQKVSDNASGWIESTPTTFTDNHGVPDPSDIIYTNVYTPVFSGKGLSGATVRLFNADLTTQVAAQALVSNGVWTSRALEEWGPTLDRAVHAKQYVGGQASPNWIGLKVNIPPLAPGSVVAVEADQSPHISGTCWPGAAVTLEYNNDGVKHRPTVTGGTWTFRRDEPFAPGVTHRYSVTQTFASQTSVPATGSFTVRRAMLEPGITVPAEGAEVSRNTTVSGELGMEGATMRVWDEQYETMLNCKTLTSDGDWSIELTDLRYGKLSLTAQQTLENDISQRSEIRVCHVVLKPPVLLVPGEGGHLPRQSTVSGTGWPGARVTAWLVGVDEPLLREVLVSASGQWSGQVTLPQVGYYKMRLQQTSDSETSKDLLCDFQVVPSSPVIESPTQSAAIGAAVVVSGFGFPGDTVTVKLSTGTTLGSVQVLEDRTWSLSAGIDHSGGPSALTVQASCGEFVSAVSDPRPVQINTWLPHIEEPSAGRWVAAPVTFAGTGKAGVGQVVSWFNPDVVWADDLAVSDGQWRGEAMTALAPRGNWYRFRQSFAPGADPARGSDWAVSLRFEVLPPDQSN